MPYEMTVTVADVRNAYRVRRRVREEAERQRRSFETRQVQPEAVTPVREMNYSQALSADAKHSMVYGLAGSTMLVEEGGEVKAQPQGWVLPADPKKAYEFAQKLFATNPDYWREHWKPGWYVR